MNDLSLKTIDSTVLMDAAGGDRNMAAELLQLYMDLTAKELVLLEEAILSGSAPAVHAIAHKCAGSSMTCGMSEMAGLMKDLEYESSLGLLEDAQKRLTLIKEGLDAIKIDSKLFLESPVTQ